MANISNSGQPESAGAKKTKTTKEHWDDGTFEVWEDELQPKFNLHSKGKANVKPTAKQGNPHWQLVPGKSHQISYAQVAGGQPSKATPIGPTNGGQKEKSTSASKEEKVASGPSFKPAQYLVRPYFHKSGSANAFTVSIKGLQLSVSDAIGLVSNQLPEAEAVNFVANNSVMEVAFLTNGAATSAIDKGLHHLGVKLPLTRCFGRDDSILPVTIKDIPIYDGEATKADVREALKEIGKVLQIDFARWGGTKLRADSCEAMVEVKSEFLGADGLTKLPDDIKIQGVSCPTNWKGVGVKKEKSTQQNPLGPKEPWEDPVWGPKAVKRRQEAWEVYKKRQTVPISEEEEESQRLLRRPRGDLLNQALINARREEEERQQDLINGRERMEIERAEKERSDAKEEGVLASQHAPQQAQRHIHTELPSEVDEVALVEDSGLVGQRRAEEDMDSTSQGSVDLAGLLDRDSDSDVEIDVSMLDARPATRMEINRREHHYMGIFEEIVQLAIEDSTSQVDWEDVLTPNWAAVELGRILGDEYRAQAGPGLPLAEAQMTDHYRGVAKDFLRSDRGLAAWKEACEQGILSSQQGMEETVPSSLFQNTPCQ